ncbi:DUF721 domain-containing protein, partial [bacterium]
AREDSDFQKKFLKREIFSNSAKDLLSEVFKNAPDATDQELAIVQIRNLWKNAAGPLSAHSRPDTVQGDVLIVTVEKPVYRQELSFSKPAILKILRNSTDIRISDIRFQIGSIDWNSEKSFR